MGTPVRCRRLMEVSAWVVWGAYLTTAMVGVPTVRDWHAANRKVDEGLELLSDAVERYAQDAGYPPSSLLDLTLTVDPRGIPGEPYLNRIPEHPYSRFREDSAWIYDPITGGVRSHPRLYWHPHLWRLRTYIALAFLVPLGARLCEHYRRRRRRVSSTKHVEQSAQAGDGS